MALSSRMCYPAIEHVAREVVFIRDNKNIGEGKCMVIDGRSGIVSIVPHDDRAKELLKQTPPCLRSEQLCGDPFKHAYFHFTEWGGNYAEADETLISEVLKDVRVVDKRNLYYGTVPESFQEAEGYREVMKRNEELRAQASQG